MNGLINVFKDAGMTSHDVVSRLRRILGTKKIGHAGTLDPEARGVLVIGVGRGTRLLEYAGEGWKTYEAEIVFGVSSTTEDLHGELTPCSFDPSLLTDEALEAVLAPLNGTTIHQTPPMYSSVKIGGRKLYEYARAGQEIERASREIRIRELRLLSGLQETQGTFRARIQAVVSKGTYVRTLCVEIGRRIGVPAVMGDLLRTTVGPFGLEGSRTLAEVEEMHLRGEDSFFLPLKAGIGELRPVVLDEEDVPKIRLGQKVPNRYPVEEGETFAGFHGEELACILMLQDGLLRIIKNVGE